MAELGRLEAKGKEERRSQRWPGDLRQGECDLSQAIGLRLLLDLSAHLALQLLALPSPC
jgi:hypothetical protein